MNDRQPPDLPGFDVPGAVERMLGDPQLWWQALALFVEHFAGWETAWRASIGDDCQERRCVHALRSAAANVGAEALALDASHLETMLLARLRGSEERVEDSLRTRLTEAYRYAWALAEAAWRKHSGMGA